MALESATPCATHITALSGLNTWERLFILRFRPLTLGTRAGQGSSELNLRTSGQLLGLLNPSSLYQGLPSKEPKFTVSHLILLSRIKLIF